MTSVFACGLECGQIGVVGQHWQSGGGTVTIDTTTKRNGDRALRLNPSASATSYVISSTLTSANVWVIRTAIRFASLPTGNCTVIRPGDGTDDGVYFKSSDSKLYPGYGGGTPTFGADGVSVTTGVWYIVNLRLNTSANPHTIDVKVDSTTTTQLTHAIGASNSTIIILGSTVSTTADMYFDDVVFSNTSGDYPIGDGYVNHFVPTSDVSHNIAGAADFRRSLTGVDITNATTTAYQLIDEVPLDTGTPTDFENMVAPPNNTDYTQSQFGPAPGISTPTTGPRAVEVICPIAQAGTGTGNMALRLNDNSTINDIYSATAVAGVTTCVYKRKHYATAPSTGTAWSSTLFNALKIRFGSPAAVDANPDQYFVGAMIEAEFAAVVATPRSFAFMHG